MRSTGSHQSAQLLRYGVIIVIYIMTTTEYEMSAAERPPKIAKLVL